MKDNQKIIEGNIEKLLSLMGVSAKTNVSFDETGKTFVVDIEAGDSTGLLIGKRGETLLSIQTILSVLYKQETGEWGKIVVNVGDYRQKEEEYLNNLATSAAQRAIETGTPQNLYNLKPWQRRVIHLSLSEDKSVETISEGEGEDRHLVISPKK